MRRCVFLRILALVLFACFWFWLGTKQRCDDACLLTKGNAFSRQDGEDANLLRVQTAKFYRNARKYALDRKCCGKKNISSLESLSEREASNLFRHIIVDKKNNFLYCFVPKVASSNMKRLILTLQGKSENSDAIKHFDQRGFEFLGDFSVPERRRLVKTLFKFMFVRDPLGRLVSAYRNKFQSVNLQFHRMYGTKIVQRYREKAGGVSSQRARGHDVTFPEFARYVIDEPAQNMNEHWMPIYDVCQPCVVPYDFVGSFEYLDLDASALLDRINASGRVSFPKKQAFYKTQLKKSDELEFYKNLTLDQYESLHRKYKKDFNCFGYEFPKNIRILPNS